MRLLGSGIGKKDQVDWDMVPPQSYQHCRAVRSASIPNHIYRPPAVPNSASL
jgi:hypothetical protein